MVGSNDAAAAALQEAIQKLGRARLACDLCTELAAPALRQLETAQAAVGTAATLLQEVIASLVSP
jgi:hypothetical protein